MSTWRIHVFFTLALLQLISCTFGEPNVISFGDFMEFDVGIHKACEKAAGGANTTWAIIGEFQACTYKISDTPAKDMFESYDAICKNRAKYLSCWDKMKAEALKKCGSDKEPMLPAVYRATVASFCGSDNGAKKIANLRLAFAENSAEDVKKCPEETGIHWVENCKSFLSTMNSGDLCARHGAIDRCLEKITCDSVKLAKAYRQVYSESRPHLQCNERRA